MELSSISIAITSLVGTLFSPGAMFTTGVNGAWYDPSDFSTMFQDAAGTTPVTAVEQPVGLMLDKSNGLVLGPELVTNGTFTTDLSGWNIGPSITASAVSGEAVVNFAGALSTTSGNWFSLAGTGGSKLGQRYRIEFDATYVSGGDLQAGTGWTVGRTITGSSNAGVKTRYSVDVAATNDASTQNSRATFGANAAATWRLDNISVRELPGNHAFNPSGNSANFPVLSARYNLLTKTEDFSDAVWVKSLATVTANAIAAPDGTLTADRFDRVNTTPAYASYGVSKSAQSIGYSFSIAAKRGTGRYIAIRLQGTYPNRTDAVFDLLTGAVGTVSNFGSGFAGTASIVDQGNGWYRCTLSSSTSDTATSIAPVFSFNTDGSNQPDTAGSASPSSGYAWGADLRVANDALNQPAYQGVNTASDYDTVGFKPYLSFNGVNQWLQTNSIDFTYGDKMFVAAGVRKLGDSGTQMIAELSTDAGANNGFYIASIGSNIYSKLGTPDSLANFLFTTAPASAVISVVYDKAKTTTLTSIITRINRSQLTGTVITEADALGNFSNYPLYIGARAGSLLWFNGRLYGLVVAGKAASASEIANTEAWLNQKTGAY